MLDEGRLRFFPNVPGPSPSFVQRFSTSNRSTTVMKWTQRPGPTHRCVSLLLVGVVLLSVGLSLGLSTPVRADGMAQFSFDPSTVEAQPGETFTVDLDLRSTPQFATGASKVGVVVVFNETYLEAADVERGPFMNLRKETTIRTNMSEIDNERGYLVYDLHREPPEGGTHGYATFARITFEVREDAPNGTSKVGVGQARVLLTDGMYQQVRRSSATVEVTRADPPQSDDPARESTSTSAGPSGADSGPGDEAGLGVTGLIVAVVGSIGLFGGAVALALRL